MRKFRIILFLFVPFLVSRVVIAASVVTTEFEMQLPRPFQQKLIDDSWQKLQKEEFEFNWQIQDQIYQAPDVQVMLSGISLDLKTKLQKPDLDPGGETLHLRSVGLSADLNIASIAVDQYIEREVGGVIGRFRIQAQCENVQLHMLEGKGFFEMILSPLLEGSLVKSHLDDATLDWSPDAWALGPMNCHGAEGFEDVVRAEILKQTGNAAKLTEQKSSLMNLVQKHLDTKSLDLSKSRALNSHRPDILASMTVAEFVGSGTEARVRGEIEVTFLKSANNRTTHWKLSSGSLPDVATDKARLRIPETFITAVAEEAFSANSWSVHLDSQEVPGFSSLMKSWWKRFFAWPALLNYDKATTFIFDISSSRNIRIQGRGLEYKVATTLNAKMQAPEQRRFIPFMHFEIPFNADVGLSLHGGRVLARFSDLQLSIHPTWEESYLEDHSVSRRFLEKSITKRVLQAAEGLRASYLLPQIPLSDSLFLQVIQIDRLPASSDLVLQLQSLK